MLLNVLKHLFIIINLNKKILICLIQRKSSIYQYLFWISGTWSIAFSSVCWSFLLLPSRNVLNRKQRSKIRSNLYWMSSRRLSICIQLSLYLLNWKYAQQLNIRLQCCSSDVSIRNHFNVSHNMLYKWSLLNFLCIHYLSDIRVSLNYADCNEELNWLADVDYFNSNLNGLIITHNYYGSEYFRMFKKYLLRAKLQ